MDYGTIVPQRCVCCCYSTKPVKNDEEVKTFSNLFSFQFVGKAVGCELNIIKQ